MFSLLSYKSLQTQEASALAEVDFSIARYEPMIRLLSNDDLQFLKSQRGYRPEMGRIFTRERRRIFRLYLRELASDFHRLHAHARRIVASLPAENSSLVGMLLRQKFRFWYQMANIELCLSLNLMGAGSFNARALLDALATMHAEVGRFAAPAPMAI